MLHRLKHLKFRMSMSNKGGCSVEDEVPSPPVVPAVDSGGTDACKSTVDAGF